MASEAARALLTQALELLAQEPTDVVTEVATLQLKQQIRDLQTRYQKTLEDLRKAEDVDRSITDLERQVLRLTEERDYYRTAYINTLEAKTALLNGEIHPSNLK